MSEYMIRLILSLSVLALAGCASMTQPFHQTVTVPAAAPAESPETMGSVEGLSAGSGAIGGSLQRSMDENDKSKASKGLDGAVGKEVRWTNAMSQTTYVMIPTEKVTINQNPYCRKYRMQRIVHDNTQEMNGTACIGSDGNWHET